MQVFRENGAPRRTGPVARWVGLGLSDANLARRQGAGCFASRRSISIAC
jgi:hypothetical protein